MFIQHRGVHSIYFQMDHFTCKLHQFGYSWFWRKFPPYQIRHIQKPIYMIPYDLRGTAYISPMSPDDLLVTVYVSPINRGNSNFFTFSMNFLTLGFFIWHIFDIFYFFAEFFDFNLNFLTSYWIFWLRNKFFDFMLNFFYLWKFFDQIAKFF